MKRLVIILAIAVLTAASPVRNPKIQYGPWICNVSETGFNVLWKSAEKTFVWVEIAPDDGSAFEACERTRYYQTVNGCRISGQYHSIPIKGLDPGKTYRYRIYGKVIEDDSSAYGTDYGPEKVMKFKGEAKITTLDSGAKECRFLMLNDIHGKDENFEALTKDINLGDMDFMVMNGDMMSYITEADTMLRHVFTAVPEVTSSIPTIYCRGNHETRGRDAYKFGYFCPTPSGMPYFTFRQGPVAFVVLDAGEDKPDSGVAYSGTADYDTFRQEELEWLKQAVEDPEFAQAPYKVAVIHVPALRYPDSWYPQIWINENFVPVLNEAGIDVMLSGHHHKHIYVKPGECGNEFPIIVNSNVERLEFEADSEHLSIATYDMEGRMTHSY